MSFIRKDIENKSIIWFENSNQYVIFEKKTADIISQIFEKIPLKNIGEKVATDLNIPLEKAMDFVFEIDKKFIKNSPKQLSKSNTYKYHKKYNKTYDYKKFYKINSIVFLFEYESEYELDLIHPKFAYLESEKTNKQHTSFQLFTEHSNTFLLKNNEYFNHWDKKNIHYLQGKVSMQIVEELHQKDEDKWLGVYHASALGYEKKSILFLGDSGNGKSTSLAILQANGFDCIADDFVPFSTNNKVYPFPSAISVKKSSWKMLSEFYPNLNSEKEYHFSSHQKTVRYLPPIKKEFYQSFDCNELVFIKYKKEQKTRFEKISNLEAFERLIPDSWISQKPKNVELFLNWFSKTKCYTLTYSNNQEMINIVAKLFKDEL